MTCPLVLAAHPAPRPCGRRRTPHPSRKFVRARRPNRRAGRPPYPGHSAPAFAPVVITPQNVSDQRNFLPETLPNEGVHNVLEVPSHQEIDSMNACCRDMQGVRGHTGRNQPRIDQPSRETLDLRSYLQHGNLRQHLQSLRCRFGITSARLVQNLL